MRRRALARGRSPWDRSMEAVLTVLTRKSHVAKHTAISAVRQSGRAIADELSGASKRRSRHGPSRTHLSIGTDSSDCASSGTNLGYIRVPDEAEGRKGADISRRDQRRAPERARQGRGPACQDGTLVRTKTHAHTEDAQRAGQALQGVLRGRSRTQDEQHVDPWGVFTGLCLGNSSHQGESVTHRGLRLS